MFSVSYDYHKVSLGCWSSQPAAAEATSPLSHEMTWQAAQRVAHNIESMMLVLHTHKTPRKMLTQYQHVLLRRGVRKIDNMSETNQTHTYKEKKQQWKLRCLQMDWLSSPLSLPPPPPSSFHF